MRIRNLSVHVVERTLDGTVWNPRTRWTRKTALLVGVHTDEGLSGLGECWLYDAEPDALAAFIATEVEPVVAGRDPAFIEAIAEDLWQRSTLDARAGIMASAASGVDVALWDLLGRATGRPVFELLGARRCEVPVYAGAGLYRDGQTPATIGAEMAGLVDAGFDAVKMKIGGLDLERDLERVAAARAAIGPERRLIVDAVYSYDRIAARRACERLREHGVHCIQAPLAADDVRGMAELNRRGPVPVMGLEAEHRPDAFLRLLEEGAVSVLQFSITTCGGFTRALRLVALAEAWHVPCSLQCSSSALAEVASFHLAAARAGVDSVEFHTYHRLLYEHLPPGLDAPRAGKVALPRGPGLGIDIPPDALRTLHPGR